MQQRVGWNAGYCFGGDCLASFYLEPEDRFYLASLSSHPVAQRVEIAEIGIDPEKREWTFILKGKPQGDEALWEEIAQAVRNQVPEVLSVRFEWTIRMLILITYTWKKPSKRCRIKSTTVPWSQSKPPVRPERRPQPQLRLLSRFGANLCPLLSCRKKNVAVSSAVKWRF